MEDHSKTRSADKNLAPGKIFAGSGMGLFGVFFLEGPKLDENHELKVFFVGDYFLCELKTSHFQYFDSNQSKKNMLFLVFAEKS